jgi:DedD protein
VDDRLKRRLVGAVVLIALGVIFIPMILDGSGRSGRMTVDVEIPPAPVYEVPDRLPPLPSAGSTPPSQEPPVRSEEASLKAVPSAPAPEKPEPTVSRSVEPEEPATAPKSEGAAPSAWVVQVGSFEDQAKALALRDKLRKSGFPSFVEPYRSEGGKTLYRVRVGPELKRELAEQAQSKIKREHKLDGLVVTHP